MVLKNNIGDSIMKNLIPYFIAEKYRDDELEGRFHGVAMFLDITGFTSITEELMKHGSEGAEVLSRIINNVFDPIIDLVYKSGGFISSFAGDAFTTIYKNYKNPESILSYALEIIQVFREIGQQTTKYGEFQLSIKIGLSFGLIEYKIIGSEHNRTYYFRGEAIDGCAESEHQCGKMEIVLDSAILDIIDKSKIEFRKIDDKFYKLIAHKNSDKDIYENFEDMNYSEILNEFMPERVIESKLQGEFRDIISIFISLKENDNLNEMIIQIKNVCKTYGGYFNRVDFGDKGCVVLIFFGAPISYENNLLRAVNFISSIKEKYSNYIRAGITKGMSYAGFIGSDRRCEYTCFSDLVNLSARFMMKAKFGEIWLNGELSKKIRGEYELDNLGMIKFKGKSKAVEVFQLKNKIKAMESVFFTDQMVGREKELELLNQYASPLENNKFAGITIIYGEAGMGKSRLLWEFIKDRKENQVLFMQTDSILKNSMNPLKYFMKNYFLEGQALSVDERKVKFEFVYNKLLVNLLELNDNRKEKIIRELKRTKSVLSTQIDIFYENSLYEQLDPKGRYENTLFAYKELFKALSLLKPIIIQIEDIHCLDNDSQKVFQTLCRNIDDYPIMIIASGRFDDKGAKPVINTDDDIELHEIILHKFDISSAEQFIKLKLEAEADESLLRIIEEKSENNPFFIEQIIIYLKENNLLTRDKGLCKIADKNFQIPSNINSIIISRIDRLESELKNILQIASIFGKEVELILLLSLIELYDKKTDNKNVLQLLDKIEEELIWMKIAEIKYIFKHALFQEAVYEMQLKERIRKLHLLAGKTIEKIYSGNKDKFIELSYHFHKAEVYDKAADYYEKTADYYKDNYNNLAAIEQYDNCLKLIDEPLRILRINMKKGSVLELIGKWKDAEKIYRENIGLSETVEGKLFYSHNICSLANLYKAQGIITDAVEYAEKAKILAHDLNDIELLSRSLGILGNINLFQGNSDKALEYLKQIMIISNDLKDKKWYVIALGNMGIAYHRKCEMEKAYALYEKQRIYYLEVNDKRNYSIVIGNIGNIHYREKNYSSAMDCYKEKKEICSEIGDLLGYALAVGSMGLIYADIGEYSNAVECIKEQKDICKELGDKRAYAVAVGNLGTIYDDKGDLENAFNCFQEQIIICKSIGEKASYATAMGNMGIIYRKLGNFDDAIKCHKESMEICREIDDRLGSAIEMSNLGQVFFKLEDFPKALQYFEIQKEIFQELRDKFRYAYSNLYIGQIKYELGFFDEALKCYHEASDIFLEIDHKMGYSRVRVEIARVNSIYSRFEEAYEYFSNAVKVFRELGLDMHLCNSLYHLSNLLYNNLKIQDAKGYNEEAYTIAVKNNDKEIIFLSKILKFKIEKNIEALSEILLEYKNIKNKEALIHYEIWKISNHNDHLEKALDLYQKLYQKTSKYDYKQKIEELSYSYKIGNEDS